MTIILVARSPAEREACLAIRQRVFVEEQAVPIEEEVDDKEELCTHFLALAHPDAPLARSLGTARLFFPHEHLAKAQRVAVVRSARGTGVGTALMGALEGEARRRGATTLALSSQVLAVAFYEHLGFQAFGPVYLDAGISHRDMRKALS